MARVLIHSGVVKQPGSYPKNPENSLNINQPVPWYTMYINNIKRWEKPSVVDATEALYLPHFRKN